jgi:hypothetical protein
VGLCRLHAACCGCDTNCNVLGLQPAVVLVQQGLGLAGRCPPAGLALWGSVDCLLWADTNATCCGCGEIS